MRSLVLAALLLVSTPVRAQDAPDADPVAAAVAEFKAIALKKVPPKEQPARNAEVAAWAERTAALDLGDYGFLRELARYFARDYVGAGDGLLAWLDTHPTLPTADYDIFVGRICLARAAMAARESQWAVFDRALPVALERYTPCLTIYKGAGGILASKKDDAEARARLAALIGRLMTDTRLTVDERLDIAGAVLAPPAAKKPTRPQPVFKPFTATDMDGMQRSTDAYKGKVLLIDFWATWCGPCIGEMPNVVKAYGEFHDAGFEILGVTLDATDAEAKIRAKMADLGMTWPQIYDGGGWKAKLAVDCNVKAIPATFLIGRDGTVRATNLRGPALRDAIAKLVAEPAPKAGADF